MAKGQKQYTDEFRNTIVELYNAGKWLNNHHMATAPCGADYLFNNIMGYIGAPCWTGLGVRIR